MNNLTYQITDYNQIRDSVMALYPRILKLIRQPDLVAAGKQLGVWENGSLTLGQEQGLAFFQDYLVYSYRPNKINMAELFLRINRAQLSEQQIDLLTRMSQSKFGLIALRNANPIQHTLEAQNILTGEEFVMVDVAASEGLKQPQLFAGHWLNFGDFSTQTGAGMGVPATLVNVAELQPILSNLSKKHHQGQTISPLDTSKLAKACVRYLLKEWA